MPTDRTPIPPEALPPGWGPAEVRDDRLAYRRSRPPIELIAELTDADRSHPCLGISRCWELRYRHPIAEPPITESIGHVSTRNAALEGLLECMSRVHQIVDEPRDPVEIHSALTNVSLTDFVPERASQLR
ncbi:hypothetical protein [Natronobeatus ordinarius]|uniref:hypothetical protein n=1 Tax=Natronobeatus ordinarius TaxID=2963433 RepID=UPI0020CE7A3B|nr:hypothetical protein [Natronobeatus ordinarius]